MPADATNIYLYTAPKDTDWYGCTWLEREVKWLLPWLPPRVASLKTSLRVRLFVFTLFIERTLETITVFLIASNMEDE